MHRYNSVFISPDIDGFVNAFIRGKIKYNMNKYTLYTHTITRQTITVWAHTTTLWVNSPQITDVKQLSEPHVHQGPSPTTQTTNLWIHT